MNIQLSESGYLSENYLSAPLSENDYLSEDKTNYVFVPAGYFDNQEDMYVRADYFDDFPEDQYDSIMWDLMQYQEGAVDEMGREDLAFIGKWFKNMKANKEKRKEYKAQKRAAKIAKKQAKTDIKIAKAEGIRTGTYTPGISGIAKAIMGGDEQQAPGQPVSPDAWSIGIEGGQPQKKKFPTWAYIAIAGGAGLLVLALTMSQKKR